MENKKNLKDCYYSPAQLAVMFALGCRMKVTLNGQLVSQIVDHGVKHELMPDEKFVGTAPLEIIDCVNDGLTLEMVEK